jgi:hypothetical protein
MGSELPGRPSVHRYPLKCPHCGAGLTGVASLELTLGDDQDTYFAFSGLDKDGWLKEPKKSPTALRDGKHKGTECVNCMNSIDAAEILSDGECGVIADTSGASVLNDNNAMDNFIDDATHQVADLWVDRGGRSLSNAQKERLNDLLTGYFGDKRDG